jgi:arginase
MTNKHIISPFYLDEPVPGLELLAQADWLFNKPQLPGGDTQGRMSIIHRGITPLVEETVRDGDRPVVISGDCCITTGVLAGLQRAGIDPILVWFDAHGDFNTWETTPSGFLGGMPLAMLVGLGEQRMPQAVGLNSLPEERVILADARDLDPGEKDLLDASRVNILKDVMDLLEYSLPDRPLYVHFDTDVIDPADAPAMNYPAPGGPSASELNVVFQHLARSADIVAVSLSSWNPELDEDNRTGKVCIDVLNCLLDG